MTNKTLIAIAFLAISSCGGSDTKNNSIVAQVLSPYGAESGSGRDSCTYIRDDIEGHIRAMERKGYDPQDIYSARVKSYGANFTVWWHLFIRGDRVRIDDSPNHCRWEWGLL